MKKEERYETINGKKVRVEVYPTPDKIKETLKEKRPKRKKKHERMQSDDFFDWNESATYC